MINFSLFLFLSIPVSSPSQTQIDRETLFIFADREIKDTPVSTNFISREKLKTWKHSDVGRVLGNVPGVYLQEEDGLGLRPNIGLRGVHPHRSRKITLLEDGILIAPAPYSSPAAYYFPGMHKIEGVEIQKGPSSARYGPHTIGGVVNLLTRPTPNNTVLEGDVAYGISNSSPYQKLHFFAGGGNSKRGGHIEVARLTSDGIKTLPQNLPTGFVKNDVSAKVKWSLFKHKFKAKFGFAEEKSHETYLGVGSFDFSHSPYERYMASSRDLMDWKHYQIQLHHGHTLNSNLSLASGVYHHRFDRSWFKFKGFKDNMSIKRLMDKNGSHNMDRWLILKGKTDSILGGNKNDHLVLGDNDRKYISQGAFINGAYLTESGKFSHDIGFGFRFHQDKVGRLHTSELHAMTDGRLLKTNDPVEITTDNTDTTQANSIYLEDTISRNQFKITIGSRMEHIKSHREKTTSFTEILPSIGLFWKIQKNLGIFSGMGKGIVLPGPGDVDAIPEESLNYEIGLRYNGLFNWETTGFFNDYRNIKGTCTLSSGCDQEPDREFNGGRAVIYGVESLIERQFPIKRWNLVAQINHTFTKAVFDGNFTTTNPEWGPGFITKGDPLPYIPSHQFNLSLGINRHPWSLNMTLNHREKMFDQSVQEERKTINSHTVIDSMFRYAYGKKSSFYLRVDNIFNNVSIVSYRPYGARPGKPRSLLAGLSFGF